MSTAPIVLGQFRPYSDPHIPNPPRDTRVRVNVGIIDLPDAAIVNTDASDGNIFRVVISGNRVFSSPTNLAEGATYMWIIKEDSTGGYTPTFDTLFDFAIAPTWNTAPDAVNIVSGVYEAGLLRVLHNKGW